MAAHECQSCGAPIGYFGRLLQFLHISPHACKPQKPWTVDRDGRVRTDRDRPVILKASK